MTDTQSHEIEERVEDLLRSPLGCAFLAIIDESSIHPAVAAVPEISMHAAALAVDETYIWSAIHEEIMEYLPQQRERLKGLARAILQDPKTDWWFAPLAPGDQCWASRDNTPPDSSSFGAVSPETSLSRNERWAQRIYHSGLFTSTLVNGKSSFHALLDRDHDAIRSMSFKPPLQQWRLVAHEAACIYEITAPEDWHNLCIRYPARASQDSSDHGRELDRLYPLKHTTGNDIRDDSAFRIDNWLTPDWYAVANDYDAVHLTFGGLLTSDKVRVESYEGWSMTRLWDEEQTLWFRWMFSDSERLPDYVESESPIELYFPFLHVPERQGVAYYRLPT